MNGAGEWRRWRRWRNVTLLASPLLLLLRTSATAAIAAVSRFRSGGFRGCCFFRCHSLLSHRLDARVDRGFRGSIKQRRQIRDGERCRSQRRSRSRRSGRGGSRWIDTTACAPSGGRCGCRGGSGGRCCTCGCCCFLAFAFGCCSLDDLWMRLDPCGRLVSFIADLVWIALVIRIIRIQFGQL